MCVCVLISQNRAVLHKKHIVCIKASSLRFFVCTNWSSNRCFVITVQWIYVWKSSIRIFSPPFPSINTEQNPEKNMKFFSSSVSPAKYGNALYVNAKKRHMEQHTTLCTISISPCLHLSSTFSFFRFISFFFLLFIPSEKTARILLKFWLMLCACVSPHIWGDMYEKGNILKCF